MSPSTSKASAQATSTPPSTEVNTLVGLGLCLSGGCPTRRTNRRPDWSNLCGAWSRSGLRSRQGYLVGRRIHDLWRGSRLERLERMCRRRYSRSPASHRTQFVAGLFRTPCLVGQLLQRRSRCGPTRNALGAAGRRTTATASTTHLPVRSTIGGGPVAHDQESSRFPARPRSAREQGRPDSE